MNEKINEILTSFCKTVKLSGMDRSLLKLYLEKTYIMGMQEGSARVFQNLENNLT